VEKNNLYFLYEISSQRGATRIALLVKEETRMLLKLLQSWHMWLHRQICLVNAGSMPIVEMLKLSRSRSHSSIQSLLPAFTPTPSRFPVLFFHRICGTSLDGLAAGNRYTNAATRCAHSSNQESRPKPRSELP
jgi:hypothetical protein